MFKPKNKINANLKNFVTFLNKLFSACGELINKEKLLKLYNHRISSSKNKKDISCFYEFGHWTFKGQIYFKKKSNRNTPKY